MAKQKLEAVTASFHFLQRTRDSGGADRQLVPFTQGEFDQLISKIESLRPVDMSDPEVADMVRFRTLAPLGAIIRVNSKTAFGTFQSGYWGHAYDNTAKGRIPADSISLRKFFYLIYLADNGSIYVGSQYLGLFGGYSALQNTLRDFLGDPKSIWSHSFHLGSAAYRNARPVAVRVAVSDKSRRLGQRGSLASRTLIAFKKESKNDGFEQEVAARLFPKFDLGKDAMKHAVADMMNESSLLQIDDSNIEDATVIAMVGKQRKTIHLIEAGDFATRFPLDVDLDLEGHPVEHQARDKMMEVLEEEIIARRV